MENPLSSAFLQKLVNTKMPFGKYKGRYLIDIPEPYIVWMHKNDLPPGELGQMLGMLYEIKRNGLEDLLRPLKEKSRAPF